MSRSVARGMAPSFLHPTSFHPSAWKGNSPKFALTEFYEVHSESALGAKTAIGIGASLVAAFLLDLRFGALRVEAQVGRRWLITPQAV
jgi:hypothetical protein